MVMLWVRTSAYLLEGHSPSPLLTQKVTYMTKLLEGAGPQMSALLAYLHGSFTLTDLLWVRKATLQRSGLLSHVKRVLLLPAHARKPWEESLEISPVTVGVGG